jgi:DNA-directed RNA polymerase beta' subunit
MSNAEREKFIDEYVIRRGRELKKTAGTVSNKKLREEAISMPECPIIKIYPNFDPRVPEARWGDIHGVARLDHIYNNLTRKCVAEKQPVEYKVARDHYIEEKTVVEKGKKGGETSESAYVDPYIIKDFFKAIDEDVNVETGEPREWSKIIGFGKNKLSALIMTALPVLPNTQRPTVLMPVVTPHPLSKAYEAIVTSNNALQSVIKSISTEFQPMGGGIVGSGLSFDTMRGAMPEKETIMKLGKEKVAVAGGKVYDELNVRIRDLFYANDEKSENTFDTEKTRGGQIVSIATTINGKHGLIRHDMLGKGSDHSGRAVVIGNPELFLDEIGVSSTFAQTVTVPELIETEEDVAKWSAEMPRTVEGKRVMGKILKVIRTKHEKERVYKVTPEFTMSLEIGDVVRRELEDGDPAVPSRQPVLHKGGLMGFKTKIFKDSANVFQLHPAVVGPFNADFDGDELNVAIPQELSRRQSVLNTMMVSHCIRGDKYSAPWIGHIQNVILAGVRITLPNVLVEEHTRDRIISLAISMFSRRNPGGIFRTDTTEYFRILNSLEKNINPASGRALVSFFLPKNFSYESRRKGKEPVIVEDGFLLSGVLEKEDIG